MRVDTLTPVVEAAPGDLVIGRVRIANNGNGRARYVLRIVGLDGDDASQGGGGVELDAGEQVELDVPMAIPAAFAAGHHAVAVEVRSDRPGERAALAALTVRVESIERLAVEVRPSTIRGRRHARFAVDLTNREPDALDVGLEGAGHDLDVRLEPSRVVLAPGQSARVRGRVRGPSHVGGETLQHVFTISARGRSQPATVTATYRQRPTIPRPLRIFALVMSVLMLWAAILAYGVYWFAKHNNQTTAPAESAPLVIDTNGDGIPDAPASAPGGANGSASGGTTGGGSAGAPSQAPGDQAPTATIVNGKVKAGDTGENDGVSVTLAPLDLGAPTPAGATVVGAAGKSRPEPLKLWPARYGLRSAEPLRDRATISVQTQNTATDGAWLFQDVAIRANYEVHFAKPGFDSQSFVVTPPDDGSKVKLDVTLQPAKGAIAGRVVAAGGTPLGGVDIVVTDGTLTFSTTSSTAAGAIGTWSLSGVSTPSTYTLSATLRGYGTEVLQLPMRPGEQKTGVRVVMTPGVGSLSGHVTAGGKPLGGVAITASNGDVTRTTTTLTDGDNGFYHFPQLPIPGDYTVTVDVPGYVTQTRRVAVDGPVSGVDFALTRTTATITGVVAGNTLGPLPGAAVTITKDDLTFRTLTAVAPDAGSFTVGDLPPGTYLVELSRFDHRTESRLVTVAAGETKDLGTITLVFEQKPMIDQTGRIVVSITDITGAPLTGATVAVSDIANNNVVASSTDTAGTQATFAFDRVPIGTYIVRASRPIYRTATQRVSVGLGEVRITFQLLKLGQVSGRIVDSLNPQQQLTDYEITLWRVNADGTQEKVQVIVVPPNAAPNADGDILWESTPNSLTTGVYRVEVSRPPPGYSVANDQILDNTLPPTSPRMRFQIRPDDESPVRVNDIQADPYPKLSGHVYVPQLGANNQVDFVPIDADMTVTMTCPNGLRSNVPATLTDELGNSPAVDTFTFDAVTIQVDNLVGACVITVSSAGFTTAIVPLSTPLNISDGVTRSDRIVNIALFPTNPPLGGTVFWRDLGTAGNQEVPIGGALIQTITPVIIGFASAQGTDPTASPRPILSPTPLQTTSTNGFWQLAGQVFGQTTYRFSNPAYDDGTMQVTIDETGRRITALSSLTLVDTTPTPVEMRPHPGRILGQVTIATTDVPQYSAVSLSATPPGAAATTVAVGADGSFVVDPAVAGTWTLSVTPPPNHVVSPTSSSTFSGRVDPSATLTGFHPTLVELAQVTVRVLDVSGQPIDVNGQRPSVTLAHTQTGTAGDPPSSSVTLTTDATGNAVFTNVDVNRQAPTTFVQYTATVAMPGFDPSTATTTITGTASGSLVASGATFGFAVQAGRKPVATTQLPRFGVIAGHVLGQIGPDASSPTEPIPVGPPLSIVARRVLDVNLVAVNDPPVAVTTDPSDPNGFVFAGPAGYYTIDVSHPFYESPPVQVPASSLPTTPPVYAMTNDQRRALAPDFVLRILNGSLALRTVLSLSGNVAVTGATATLKSGANVVAQGTVDVTGSLLLPGLVPGDYTLDIRARDGAGDDVNFPVHATVTIPRGATDADRTLTVRAPMPFIGGSIVGKVVSTNIDGAAVPLPQTVTIDRSFTAPQIDANGNLVPNGATESDLSRTSAGAPQPQIVIDNTADPTATTAPYTFLNLAAPGVHHVAFSTDPAYTTPAAIDVDVDPAAPTTVADARYVAKNVTLVVQLRDNNGAPITTATVTLTPPGGGPVLTPSAAGGDYTFSGVPPDARAYGLTVTDVFHVDLNGDPLTVLPDADGSVTVTRTLRADAALVQGTAEKQDGPGVVDPLVGTGTVTLYKLASASDTVGTAVTTTTPGTAGAYQFSVADPGNYRVEVSATGYAARDAFVSGVTLGNISSVATIVVPKVATVAITVSGGATSEPTLAVTMTKPTGLPAATRSGNVFTFSGLDPDLLYAFLVSADTYIPQTVPSSGDLDPAVGSTNNFTVTLVQRTVVVTVATSDNDNSEKSATVHVRVPSTNTAGQLTQTGDGTSAVYTFVPVPLGSGEVDAVTAGHRARTVTLADGGPTQNVSITLRPLVTVSGLVQSGNNPVSGATVTATLGATTKTATTNASGNYTLSGLDVGTWSINAVKDGTGAGTAASVTITATSADTVTQNFTLTPRTVTVTFTVTSGGTAVSGAVVTLDSQSATTGASGVVTLSVPETGGLAWTVREATHLTASGTVTPTTTAVAVPLVVRPTLSGTVNSGGNALAGANVFLCPDGTSPCNSGSATASTTSGASGTFAFRPDVGTWEVRATSGGLAAIVTNIAVGADGSISNNNIVLNVA